MILLGPFSPLLQSQRNFYSVDLFILLATSVVVERKTRKFGFLAAKTLRELSKQHLTCGKSEIDGRGKWVYIPRIRDHETFSANQI